MAAKNIFKQAIRQYRDVQTHTLDWLSADDLIASYDK
jgi:hypothetical protein